MSVIVTVELKCSMRTSTFMLYENWPWRLYLNLPVLIKPQIFSFIIIVVSMWLIVSSALSWLFVATLLIVTVLALFKRNKCKKSQYSHFAIYLTMTKHINNIQPSHAPTIAMKIKLMLILMVMESK